MEKEKTMTPEEFYAERREAAKRIDPETAEIYWNWTSVLDPYRVYPPFEEDNVGRVWFAHTPEEGSVSFYDLPEGNV